MTTDWKGVHMPAAHAWVRTEIDVRRYLDENAADIYVRLQGRNYALADLPPVVRMMFVVRFIDRWRESKWLPGTLADTDAAIAAARAHAAATGGSARVGIMGDDGKLAAVGVVGDDGKLDALYATDAARAGEMLNAGKKDT